MITLLQRVTHAHVTVRNERVGAIERGLLALVAFEAGDTPSVAERMLERVLGYRVFADDAGKMNLSVRDIGGGLLLVPQFTLAADTSKGMRPSFASAGTPEDSRALFEAFVAMARARYAAVASGVFGVAMQVSLTNDGPVTFLLQVLPPAPRSDKGRA
jgi:D-tyrosyl-tRNA(Tyr) deacylase